jgi:hypothetical protein
MEPTQRDALKKDPRDQFRRPGDGRRKRIEEKIMASRIRDMTSRWHAAICLNR